MMKLPSKSSIVTNIMFALSIIIFLSTVIFTMRIDVVKDWRLELPQGEIHAGDTIVVSSMYTKLRDVSGESKRYVECKNQNGVPIRYEINQAVANRKSGKGGTGIEIVVPDIPNLPKMCKIQVSICYKVIPLKCSYENNETTEFQLLPKLGGSLDASQEATTSGRVQEPVLFQQVISYPNDTPVATPVQQDITLSARVK
jgi:hypothetical protein